MNSYELPLGAAKGCFKFMDIVMKEKGPECPESVPPEVFEAFEKDFNSFHSFMKLTVNSEIEVITIPDHHKRMFEAVSKMSLLVFILEM